MNLDLDIGEAAGKATASSATDDAAGEAAASAMDLDLGEAGDAASPAAVRRENRPESEAGLDLASPGYRGADAGIIIGSGSGITRAGSLVHGGPG